MLRLFTGLCTLVGFLVLVAAGLYFYRDPLCAKALEAAVERETGMVWQADSVDADIFKGVVTVNNLQLVNPGHFRDRRCLVVPRAQIEFDYKQLESGHPAIRRLSLEVTEMVIVRTAVGESNLERLRALELDPDEKRPGARAIPSQPQFLIDQTDLSVARVLALDYTAAPNPEPIVREIGLKGVTFLGIKNARDLQRAVFGQILKAARLQIPGMDVLRLAEIAPQPASAVAQPAPPAAASPAMTPILPKPAAQSPSSTPSRGPAPELPADAPAFPVPAR